MNDNFWECMGLLPDPSINCKAQREEAYKRAHEIRQFEIELFWKRGTYYWAFILAAFTAHFALFNFLFTEKYRPLSLSAVYNLPRLSLLALIITSLFCYFFSLCWVLMNKGSLFWQKTWEEKIYELEYKFSGNLYRTMLNTENSDFDYCPLSLKAYNYSVTKITLLTSIVLTIVSGLMSLFYAVIFALRLCKISSVDCFMNFSIVYWICLAGAISVYFLIAGVVSCLTEGNKTKQQQVNKWRSV
ncbi:hypothetical protein [Treponema sp. Marseille-Q4130]|uniref:RipA family octameric membrane protein n=1 Tax=Treponema sp. Marseille-Q4130 TaxID=2766702 RepID=UPI001651E897|nr:hypothetical protein [Treponema sp. Marseille-Q4130]MBC6720693.1 hypothetical protein [Treponema sp. Marseille-Q4130]